MTFIADATPGFFQCSSQVIDIPEGEIGNVTVTDVSNNYDTYVIRTDIMTDDNMTGDYLSVIVGPDTTIGFLTKECNIGDTILTVNASIFTIPLSKGMKLSIKSATDYQDLGKLVEFNVYDNTIKVTNALNSVFNTLSFIQFDSIIVNNLYLVGGRTYSIGNKGLWSKCIPENMITRVHYTNNTTSAKRLIIVNQYHYN